LSVRVKEEIVMAIYQRTLLNKASSFRQAIYESKHIRSAYTERKSAFLCHSHKDEELVKGLLAYLEEVGIDIYVDWKDNAMPETPTCETARRIQSKIKSTGIFLFLATSNSKASRWCPWEIGYADSSSKSIFIIPTYDGCSTFGNEYLELYPRIDEGSLESRTVLAIFDPGQQKGMLRDGGKILILMHRSRISRFEQE
jgi:hypothetical protein